MTIHDDLSHLLLIINTEAKKSKAFKENAKKMGDVCDECYFNGEVKAFTYSMNKIKKLISRYDK